MLLSIYSNHHLQRYLICYQYSYITKSCWLAIICFDAMVWVAVHVQVLPDSVALLDSVLPLLVLDRIQ